METEIKLGKFAKYAWFVLAYNLLVILWGVFLRASLSGDGCGEHWVTCGGEFIPSAPQLKTQIEFFHRITSSLAGITVIILLISAIVKRVKEKTSQSKLLLKMSVLSLIFIIIEGIVGGLLVLTGNTAANWTPTRPYWMAAHLVNTFTLIAVLALTAWFASGGKSFSLFKADRKVLLFLIIGTIGIFIVGMSGSIAALSSMLFPSSTLSEGIAKDFSASSHYILRLRVFHPILSVMTGLFLIFLANWLKKQSDESAGVKRWGNILTGIILIQFVSGAVLILLLTPIVMQLIHLFLADAVWISFVLMSASFLANEKALE
ncbi:MAG: COX15/CtaA family protein [Pyrinomonadaceae bacterium]|nr:COX15/CtaA family protein [Pyrinomonadaceae bacterium]